MKQVFISIVLLIGCASAASAKVYDASNQSYQMSGAINARITARCNIFTVRSSPMEYLEQFSIQFGEQIVPTELGDIVGTFQIIDDNLLDVGRVVDGEIAARKKNILSLKYAGLTQLEGAEKLKNLIHDKALAHGTDFGSAMTVTNYSFKSYVRKDSLKFVEKVIIAIPNFPKAGCKANMYVKRKLFGPLIIPLA